MVYCRLLYTVCVMGPHKIFWACGPLKALILPARAPDLTRASIIYNYLQQYSIHQRTAINLVTYLWHSAALRYIEYKLSDWMLIIHEIIHESHEIMFSGTALDVILSSLAARLECKILAVIMCVPIYTVFKNRTPFDRLVCPLRRSPLIFASLCRPYNCC